LSFLTAVPPFGEGVAGVDLLGDEGKKANDDQPDQ